MTSGQSERYGKTDLLIGVALFVMTVFVYASAFNNDFVAWDDNEYVYEQPQVLHGLSRDGILWAATANVAANWHPLTLLSLQLDSQFFGGGPLGYHRTSVLIHAVNAALMFLALFSLTGCRWKSAIVASLFAIHPMRVESVAWISERKDVLSGFFFFLTLLAYAFYVKKPAVGRYALVALCLALGLSAKSMLVTTPCVLLLLDYWPLGRVRKLSLSELPRMRQLVLEKIPLLVLTLVLCMITIFYQQVAIRSLSRIPFSERIENAAVSCVMYVAQTFWPVALSPYYSRHPIQIFYFYGAVILLIVLTLVSVWQSRSRPYLLVGWLWFLGTLVPVIGLFQVGHHARADRYMYLPQIGLFLAITWSVFDLALPVRRGNQIAAGAFAVLLLICGFLTVKQIGVWKDSKTLWQHAYRLDSNNSLALYHLAEICLVDGDRSEAVRLTRQAIQKEDRSDCETLVMLGMLMADCGAYEDCVSALNKALQFRPDDADVLGNRGKALAGQGQWQEAADDFRRASRLSPEFVSYQFYLAHALGKAGQTTESDQLFASALRKAPQWPRNTASRAWWMSTSPDARDRANFWPVCLAEQANEATGGDQPEYLDVLAAAYAESGQFDEATATAERAVMAAEKQKNRGYAALIRKRLELYKKQEPYREKRSATNSAK